MEKTNHRIDRRLAMAEKVVDGVVGLMRDERSERICGYQQPVIRKFPFLWHDQDCTAARRIVRRIWGSSRRC